MQMILQDPYSSLNPVMRIGEIIAEPLRLRQNLSSSAVREAVGEMLRQVGLSPDDYNRFPQEFSGGQRQRVGIARALIVRPAFVLCDEPISALDVSIQAQVVNLLEDMRAEYQPAYLFVAHDLSMVRHISDRIAVMYRGEVLETAGAAEVYEHPRHPYTQALLSAVPIPNPEKSRQKLAALEASASAQESEGEAESRSRGCAFVQRCPYAKQRCREEKPQLEGSAADTGHQSACFL
jgi:peptide/nickel transport system ATP-binding protein/oligopeptide transport system ATP-binding protein